MLRSRWRGKVERAEKGNVRERRCGYGLIDTSFNDAMAAEHPCLSDLHPDYSDYCTSRLNSQHMHMRDVVYQVGCPLDRWQQFLYEPQRIPGDRRFLALVAFQSPGAYHAPISTQRTV